MSSSSKIKDALAELQRDIGALRDRIAGLAEQRSKISQLPVDADTIAKRIDDYIASASREGLSIWGIAAAEDYDHRRIGESLRVKFDDDLAFVLAVLAPDRLRSAVLQNAPKNGISDSERASVLARLEADLMAAEIAEETALRESEIMPGSIALRRIDARPEILLAPDRELS